MEAHAQLHPPVANSSSRLDPQVLGILIFIASEAMIFGAFFTAYFFIRIVNDAPWPAPGTELPVDIAAINSGILLSSSVTMHWASLSIKRGNRLGLQTGMLLTLLLGATFLFIQINEYVHLGFSPSDSAQGSVFYGITGLHGAHVVIGLMLLSFVSIRAFRGHYSSSKFRGVEVPGMYWHFVDGMWVIVYSTLYLL